MTGLLCFAVGLGAAAADPNRPAAAAVSAPPTPAQHGSETSHAAAFAALPVLAQHELDDQRGLGPQTESPLVPPQEQRTAVILWDEFKGRERSAVFSPGAAMTGTVVATRAPASN